MTYKKNWLLGLFIAFLSIQPFLDIKYFYQPPLLNVLPFAIPTIVRIIGIGILFLATFVTLMKNKERLFLIGYGVVVTAYTALHLYNATKFSSVSPTSFGYSVTSEIFYLIRLILPILMVVIAYKIKLSDYKFEKIITILNFLISGSIVFSNLFKLGISSYSDVTITYNIFEWFNNPNMDYYYAATRGWFNFANAISGVLALIGPIVIYFLLTKRNAKNGLSFVLYFLASVMIGTKSAIYSLIIVLAGMFVLYLFTSLIQNKMQFSKSNFAFLSLALIAVIAIMPFSPSSSRESMDGQQVINRESMRSVKDLSFEAYDRAMTEAQTPEEKQKIKLNFIGEKYPLYSIIPQLITHSLPYEQDPDFWIDVMNHNRTGYYDNRQMEQLMLKRVKSTNNKSLDNWFGITYSRMSNIYVLERDFLAQYYTIGILGLMVFILPLVFLVIFGGLRILKHFHRLFNLKNASITFGLGMIFFISLYSGNILDFLIDTLILAFVLGYWLKDLNCQLNKEKEPQISIIVPTYNRADMIEGMLESIASQDYQNVQVIISDDGSVDNTQGVVENFSDYHQGLKIKYIKNKNGDQLNAINRAVPFITGDIIYILHSDDRFYDKRVLTHVVSELNETDYDGLFANIVEENTTTNKIKKHRTKSFYPGYLTSAKAALGLGRNPYVDFVFFRREAFFKISYESYIINNTCAWRSLTNDRLNLGNANYYTLKYQVHGDNYLDSSDGQENVLNGELRTLTNILAFGSIPLFNIQRQLFRIINKLGLNTLYYPIVLRTKTKTKAVSAITKQAISLRLKEPTELYRAIQGFFEASNNRCIELKIPEDFKVYDGSDIREFNKKLHENELHELYYQLFKEMKIGFNCVQIKSTDLSDVQRLLEFLMIKEYVRIEVIL